MAQYIVRETSFINNTLVYPGEIVEWDGKKHGDNLEPVKAPRGKAPAAPREETPAVVGEGGDLA